MQAFVTNLERTIVAHSSKVLYTQRSGLMARLLLTLAITALIIVTDAARYYTRGAYLEYTTLGIAGALQQSKYFGEIFYLVMCMYVIHL